MGRPSGSIGRPQLKEADLIRIQTLSRDARMGPSQIHKVTGYSVHQIKYALKKKTPTVGIRTGRPRKGDTPTKPAAAPGLAAGQGQGAMAEGGYELGQGQGHGDTVMTEGAEGEPFDQTGQFDEDEDDEDVEDGSPVEQPQAQDSVPSGHPEPGRQPTESTDVEQRVVDHLGSGQQPPARQQGTGTQQ